MRKTYKTSKGFTLAELLVTTVIAGVLISFAASIFFTFFGSVRNIRAANNIYEETRFVMERVIKEVRENAIDYEEYFNQLSAPAGDYGQNYCEYNLRFYGAGFDEELGTEDDVSTGKLDPSENAPLENPIQNELLLINGVGDERTIIRRIEKNDASGNSIGRIGLLKLEGFDYGIDGCKANLPLPTDGCDAGLDKDLGEGDGLVDTWRCADGFECDDQDLGVNVPDANFIDITPDAIDVKDLKFIITPKNDPFKAYSDADVQIQPHVTMKVIARANPKLVSEFKQGSSPDISLESTVSTRIYQEVISKCYSVQCNVTDPPIDCPLQLGVCAGAQQTCSAQNVWPGCDNTDYSQNATAAGEIFEPGQETICDDGRDNDCNGLVDQNDAACRFSLCTNTIRDDFGGDEFTPDTIEDEICINVGGICGFIHPHQPDGETACFDGVDNDCNNFTDDADPACFSCGDGIVQPAEECDDGDLVDGNGCSSSCTVEAQSEGNAAPEANPDTLHIGSGQVLNINIVDDLLKSNDTDSNGDDFYVSNNLTGAASSGTLTHSPGNPGDSGDDILTYTAPNVTSPSTATFDYTITDDPGDSDSATVTINIYPPKTVFITEPIFSGNLEQDYFDLTGESAGTYPGDDICNWQIEQTGAHPNLAGKTFKAWLSTQTEDAANLVLNSEYNPYINIANEVIASSKADLLDGSLQNGIAIAFNDVAYSGAVFTGTNEFGEYDDNFGTCDDWTSLVGDAAVGKSKSSSKSWTRSGNNPSCNPNGPVVAWEGTESSTTLSINSDQFIAQSFRAPNDMPFGSLGIWVDSWLLDEVQWDCDLKVYDGTATNPGGDLLGEVLLDESITIEPEVGWQKINFPFILLEEARQYTFSIENCFTPDGTTWATLATENNEYKGEEAFDPDGSGFNRDLDLLFRIYDESVLGNSLYCFEQ